MTTPPMLINPGTTNIVPNPWTAVATTGWGAGSATIERSTARALQGPASLVVSATGDPARAFYVVTIPEATYTVTFWVWHALGSTRNFAVIYGVTSYPAVAVPSGGDSWTPVSATVTGTGVGSDAPQIRLPDSVNGDVFHVGHILVEPGARRTSPCPRINASGTIIPPDMWSGTPHASTSTRPATRLPGFLATSDTHIGPLRVGERN